MGIGRALRGLGGVALVAAVTVGVAPAARADQVRDAQWALSEFQAREAVWPLGTGRGVTVAVIDSGVRATQLDLRGQVLPGTDFAFGGDGPTDRSAEGHGTGMASIIAGHGHGPGGADRVMGLAPGAKILPVGIGAGAAGRRGLDYVPQAIHYAVDHGAQVISMSVGTPSPDPAEEAAVAYAEQHNVVLVAAAGNDGSTRPQYPASWPGVVKVSAVDESGRLWSGSTTGGVTVAAPGVHIARDGGGSDTQVVSATGSSHATAYVAAVAALYRAAHPGLTAGQIVALIVKTATPPPGRPSPDPGYGYGVVHPDLRRQVDPGPASGPLPQASVPPEATDVGAGGGGSETGSWITDDGPFGVPRVVVYGGLGALAALTVLVQVLVHRRRAMKDAPDAAAPHLPQPAEGELPDETRGESVVGTADECRAEARDGLRGAAI